VNGLSNDVIPIVMGAHPKDYERNSPPKSFIHVDDFRSPKELASFLNRLKYDPAKYQEYLQWKEKGRMINTFFWCRLCSLLHSPRAEDESHTYSNLRDYWNPIDTCNVDGWRLQASFKDIQHRNELINNAWSNINDVNDHRQTRFRRPDR
jgi:glycoprotein 3-alpha-L-fucosyltransferase